MADLVKRRLDVVEERRVIAEAQGIPLLEPIANDLYDTKVYPNAGINILEFFKNPGVVAPPAGVSAVDPIYTNMPVNGQLASPQSFEVKGIVVEMFMNLIETANLWIEKQMGPPDWSWASAKKRIREVGWIRFKIGSKDYLIEPLQRIPEGVGPSGLGVGGPGAVVFLGNQIAITHGVQDIKNYYDMTIIADESKIPLLIPSQQNFVVQLYWPTLVPIGSWGAEPMVFPTSLIRVYLLGYWWREVQ